MKQKRVADKNGFVWFHNLDGSSNRFWTSEWDTANCGLKRMQTLSDRELEYLSNFIQPGQHESFEGAIKKCAAFFYGIDCMPDPFHVGKLVKIQRDRAGERKFEISFSAAGSLASYVYTVTAPTIPKAITLAFALLRAARRDPDSITHIEATEKLTSTQNS